MLEDIIRENMDKDGLWLVITFKTQSGPLDTMKMLEKAVRKAGWEVTFKANWWTADIPYGLVRIDAKKGDKEKIILGKWILGKELEVIGVQNLDLERGKEEFFRMVDSITSTLIHDPVIRTMREQY
ncbi:ribonucleoside-triphosphate reductase [Pyrococcus kukulkanii]|uniref:ribonucleoside-triphosphate reductase n=1 Tax=Pyrococcus kukulkanii TaxID=1609559 RepID=UPI000F10F2E7|nr:MAG: ribonucleoside-triphosphate reductase [Thermococci archaeon]